MKWLANIPTSKKLTWIFVWAYMIEIVFTMYAMFARSVDLTSVLTYSTPLVTLILVSYFTKSGAENVTSIKQTGSQEGEI
jgi:hypothetical protein